MVLSDLHVHSTFSDGVLTIPELVDFYGSKKFGAIAITDHLCEHKTFLGKAAHFLKKSLHKETFHEYISTIKHEARRAMDKYNMLVIPGIEITKNSFAHNDSAHILCLGLEDYIDPDLSIEEICTEARRQNALTVAAHPVSTRKMEAQTYYLWNNRERLKSYFDLWEVASGPYLFDEVFQSGLPMVASSDLHKPLQVNSWKTIVYSDLNQESILNELKTQNLGLYFYQEESHRSLSSSLSILNLQKSLIS